MTHRTTMPVTKVAGARIAAGLAGLVGVDGGPTAEQSQVFSVLGRHLLGVQAADSHALDVLQPAELAAALEDAEARRTFTQMAIMLDLCRHPRTEAQLHRLEEYVAALGFEGPQLDAARDLVRKTAAAATADFLRVYDASMPELTELQFQAFAGDTRHADEATWARVDALKDMPAGSLGREFVEFYERSGLTFPSPETPNPGYYVSHDMNHVIAGYEATGPGEIALGVFKLMMNNSEANWMASMVNFLIHEVGMFTHAKTLQFVPYGRDGEPYHGIEGRRGAMTLEGAPELVAEAFLRGAACSSDVSVIDHLAMAHLPLREVRERYHVIPLKRSMRGGDDAALWPDLDPAES